MKHFIKSQFLLLGDIVNEHRLDIYLDFCESNALANIERGQTVKHHILPRAKRLPFNQYADLNKNEWNCVILTNYNHYYAHFLLSEAINHHSILHAFCAMHNKDIKLKRIKENELISEEKYNEIYTKRNKLSSEYLLEIIEINGVKKTRAGHLNAGRKLSPETLMKASKRMKGVNNIVYKSGVVDKIRKTKLTKGLDKISAERAAATMKVLRTNERGEITTTYKENGKKLSKWLMEEYIDNQGNKTTNAKERAKTRSHNDLIRGKWLVVRNIFDENIRLVLPLNYVRKISPALDTKTKQNYLGMSEFGKNKYIRENREYLIGLFCETLSEVPQSYNLDQDYTPYF